MKNILTKINKPMAVLTLLALMVGSFGLVLGQFTSVAQAAILPNWTVTGSYVAAFNYLGTDYPHDMSLTQDGLGGLTGSGGSPAGANTYTWVVTSGSIAGDSIDFFADYTATPDAVTPLTTMHVVGTIAPGGTMSGTWSDNYAAGTRTGTWVTTSGAAVLLGTLAAEDFGVVNYDTGLGMLKGYTAGFGLTDATFASSTSVVMQLFASSTLLQTNTATAKVGTDITGVQISSPFDVSGTFDYATDGYWVNVRESQYGQSVAATRVVATVTLANGKVVTAENTNLSGDPTTIFPVVIPMVITTDAATAVTSVDAMLNGTNGSSDATGHSFWVSTSTFSTASPIIPAGAYSTVDFGAIASNTAFSALLSAATGLPVVTASTTYYFAAWSLVGGVWNPGAILNFTTLATTTEGQIGGDVTGVGALGVTSVETIDSTATADGTFTNGWEYVFNITVPTDETHLAMKFANWLSTVGSSTIAVAGNVRISSPQADNGGATVLITAADTYSVPTLNMTSDLNPALDGLQVRVTVEAAVPVGSVNGSYTTNYGVKTE